MSEELVRDPVVSVHKSVRYSWVCEKCGYENTSGYFNDPVKVTCQSCLETYRANHK